MDLLLLSLIKLVKVDSEGSAFNFKIPAKTLNPFNKLSRLRLAPFPLSMRGVRGALRTISDPLFLVRQDRTPLHALPRFFLTISANEILKLHGQTIQLLTVLEHPFMRIVQIMSDIDQPTVSLVLV